MNYKISVPRIEEDDKKETKKIDNIILVGLLLIIAILPLIFRAKIVDFISPTIALESIITSGPQGDVFTYYKFIFLLIVTSVLIILYMYRTFVLGNSIIKYNINILFSLFIFFVAASTIFSSYTSISLFGMYNRHDGAIALVLCVILFFIASSIEYSINKLKIIAYAFAPMIIINLYLGLSHFYGINVMEFLFWQKIVIPESLGIESISQGSKLQFTVNNPNYASGLASMTTILFLALSIFIREWLHKILFFILSMASYIMMLTALSQSGFLALLATLSILVIIIIFSKNFIRSIPIILLALLIFFMSIYILSERNYNVWDETLGLFKLANPFYDQTLNGTGLDADFTSAINISIAKDVHASNMNSDKIIKLPEFPEQNFSVGSGRSYIWDRTIALILEKPLFGYGMDTIIFTFPQYELEKQAGLYYMEVLVDKPHNLYLSLAYGAGLPALLLFLCGTILLLYRIYRLIKSNTLDSKYIYIVSFALFLVAYLVQGIANDAIIGVLPLFWIISGIVLSFIKEDKNLLKEENR